MTPEVWLAWVRDIPVTHVLVAFAVLGVPVLMIEMGYSHFRGNFHRLGMYVPVIVPPVFAIAGLALLILTNVWTLWFFGIASIALLATGMLGTFFHVQGIGRQTGGFNLDNVMVGPPAFAPLAFSMLATVGLIALVYWGS